MLIYRQDVAAPPLETPGMDASFVIACGPRDAVGLFAVWAAAWGAREALKAALKVCSGRRVFYGFVKDGRLVHSGWACLGFCRHYGVEPDAVVLGTAFTSPGCRGQGYFPEALRRTMAFLSRRGATRFYIDTTEENAAARRGIAKAGFRELLA